MRTINITSAYVSNDTYVHLMHYYAIHRYTYYELLNVRQLVMTLLVLAIHADDDEAVLRLLCIYAELCAVTLWMAAEDWYSVSFIHEHYYNQSSGR